MVFFVTAVNFGLLRPEFECSYKDVHLCMDPPQIFENDVNQKEFGTIFFNVNIPFIELHH